MQSANSDLLMNEYKKVDYASWSGGDVQVHAYIFFPSFITRSINI